MIRALAVLLFGVLVGVACSRRSGGNQNEDPGARLYLRSCGGCHGPTGKGMLRPGLTVLPRDLSDATLYDTRSDEQLRAVIVNGKGQMPPFKRLLTDEEIAAVIAHLHTLARRPRPKP
jgi:mono/diheme cytochrome c family protein